MEQKSHGGKRRGAGRKSVTDKKQQVVLYIQGKDILKFGNTEKLKGELNKFIDEFGKDEVKIATQPIPAVFDGPRLNPVNDEYPMFQKPQMGLKSFEQYKQEKRECETEEGWEKIKAAIKSAPNLSTKQKDLLIKYS